MSLLGDGRVDLLILRTGVIINNPQPLHTSLGALGITICTDPWMNAYDPSSEKGCIWVAKIGLAETPNTDA